MSDLKVRVAGGRDVPQIAALEKMLFSDAWSEKNVDAALSSALGLALVAEAEGEICGYLLSSLLPPEGELYRIGVHPQFRRRGAGAALMEAFLAAAKEKESTALFLEVRADNAPAIALYRRFGFVDNGIRCGYYHEPEGDALLMRRCENNEENK